ncbi:acidic tetraheme cytochrome c3 TmcA [Desulfonatronovibrio magnus]|uniref:acidic tetraheme cytochrome c3 TmcA n=1 Tax=Desulfonatronovibrio magnus TaxID=698827 RepID=UPI00069906BE|nr:cytochrome c3 family protein [Desulfonatronovibrio magnus]
MNVWIKAVLNKLFPALCILMAVLFLLPGLILSDDYRILFKDDTFVDPKRGPVIFDHDEHSLFYDCERCHHEYDEDGKLLEGVASIDLRCSDCHTLEGEGNILPLRQAYHVQCKSCHIEERSGPFTCAECHVR